MIGNFIPRSIKWVFLEVTSTNYLLLENFVYLWGNFVHILLRKANNNLNMIFMYIQKLKPLVVDIRNIFNTVCAVYFTTLEMENNLMKFYLRQSIW